MSFTNNPKNSATFAQNTKSSSAFANFLRHGTNPKIQEIADFTFESVVFADGEVLKDVTFAELTDAVWGNLTKH